MSSNRSPKPFSKASDLETNGLQDNACYFCNDTFELGQLQGHLKHCGSILEQCPLRCGAWIQRRHKDTHVQECPRIEKAASTHARSADVAEIKVEDGLTEQLKDIMYILTEEVRHRELQDTEVDTIRAKLILMEERTQHFLATVVNLRTSLDDQAERAANWEAQFKHDLANVQLGLQELQSQQLTTAMRLETAVTGLMQEQRERELLEQAVTQHDARSRVDHKLEEVIQYVNTTLQEERARNEQILQAIEQDLLETRQTSTQLLQLSEGRGSLRRGGELPDLDRLSVLEVTTAGVRSECSDLGSRLENVSRDVRALTKSYLKVRSELNDFQARVSFGTAELGSDNGHLIWRIDNFAARMKEAKENDTVLTSPLFRTSKYGYTLKVEVQLNGLGIWRGRHVTGAARIVQGAHDALLAWPCRLTLSIAVKDQATNRDKAIDIVKSLDIRRKSSSKRDDYDDAAPYRNNDKISDTVSKTSDTASKADSKSKSDKKTTDPKSDRKSSDAKSVDSKNEVYDKSVLHLKRQYFFIPHTSLDKFDYVKNDVLFFEFMVHE